jgi:hypothetical protein
MKLIYLKVARWLVFKCAEFTPPEVNYSQINCKVAEIVLNIDELIVLLHETQTNLPGLH